jgi:hypothetical protein
MAVVTGTATEPVGADSARPWRAAAAEAARRLSAITLAGALLGVLVGGVGGRLAMMLLARLNPRTAGMETDDGFPIGRFTVSGTLNLLLIAGLLGILGAGFYAVFRALLIGPRWFQVLSIAGGPAVVVGAMLVHTDGIDFTFLDPPILAIALFVAIPAVYAGALTLLAERWLAPAARLQRAPLWVSVSLLVLWIPLAPVLAVLALGWAVAETWRRRGGDVRAVTVLAWSARLILAVIFGVALVEIAGDMETLVRV